MDLTTCDMCRGFGEIATGPNDITDVDYCPKCKGTGKLPPPEENPILKWSNDLPTEPGWYWRAYDLDEPKLVKVLSSNSQLFGMFIPRTILLKGIWQDLSDFEGGSWYGPIHIPQPQD